jgi:TctA family transporter
MERYMLVALQKADGSFSALFSTPLANALWVALALSLVLPIFMKHRQQRLSRRETAFAEGEG